ncbi:MAG: SufE family protein, partial [Bdellovibrionales bacterium]
ERQKALVSEFAGIEDWEDRYRKIIEIGKALPAMPAELQTEDSKIRGCQSQVWMHAKLDEGRVIFTADSDAVLVRGLVAMLVRIYSGGTPDEIVRVPPDFIREIGLESKLTPSRTNGLASMIKQMKYYALAYQALLGQAHR